MLYCLRRYMPLSLQSRWMSPQSSTCGYFFRIHSKQLRQNLFSKGGRKVLKQARQIRQVESGKSDGFTRLTTRPSILYRQSNRQVHKLILQHHQPVAESESAIAARKKTADANIFCSCSPPVQFLKNNRNYVSLNKKKCVKTKSLWLIRT